MRTPPAADDAARPAAGREHPRAPGSAPDMPPSTLSRRRELGAPSARSLLLTVLGELLLPHDGPVWTSALLGVLDGLGVEAKAARQAVARTAAEGLLTSERAGRRVRWSLSTAARRMLGTGAERIYGFGAAAAPWDGRWLVVLVRVPESRRPVRHQLRTRLAWAGLGSPAAGVWLSPHPDKQDEVAGVLDELALTGVSSSFVGPSGAIGAVRTLVDQAWNLGDLDAAYRGFIATVTDQRPLDTTDTLTHQLRLVHAWRRFPFLDPRLPTPLLPADWPGPAAYRLFRERHRAWSPGANEAWRALLADAD